MYSAAKRSSGSTQCIGLKHDLKAFVEGPDVLAFVRAMAFLASFPTKLKFVPTEIEPISLSQNLNQLKTYLASIIRSYGFPQDTLDQFMYLLEAFIFYEINKQDRRITPRGCAVIVVMSHIMPNTITLILNN